MASGITGVEGFAVCKHNVDGECIGWIRRKSAGISRESGRNRD